MTDFIDVGGVQLLAVKDTWEEDDLQIGDIASGAGEMAASGRPIDTRAGETRIWRGRTPRVLLDKGGLTGAASWEAWKRWICGWGQCWPCTNLSGGGSQPLSGAGVVLGPVANQTMSSTGGPYSTGKTTIVSGSNIGFTHTNRMRVRRGFSPTASMGWTFGFFRKFIAGESQSAAYHWCVATGAVTYNFVAASNPAGVTQYVDGAPVNFKVGSMTSVSSTQAKVYGKKDDGTDSAIEFADIFFLPFQMPASWVSSIYAKLINLGQPFPILPRQKLSGQWLTNESVPVEVIGRIDRVTPKQGAVAGAVQTDQREFGLTFVEFPNP